MKNINLYNYMKSYYLIATLSLHSIVHTHPHSKYERVEPHTHTQYGNDIIYDLDNFDDLHFNLTRSTKSNYNSKTRGDKQDAYLEINDNQYLLDDDFDFGNDEFELKNLEKELNANETRKEYEDFLESFFNHSESIGAKGLNYSKKYFSDNFLGKDISNFLNSIKYNKTLN